MCVLESIPSFVPYRNHTLPKETEFPKQPICKTCNLSAAWCLCSEWLLVTGEKVLKASPKRWTRSNQEVTSSPWDVQIQTEQDFLHLQPDKSLFRIWHKHNHNVGKHPGRWRIFFHRLTLVFFLMIPHPVCQRAISNKKVIKSSAITTGTARSRSNPVNNDMSGLSQLSVSISLVSAEQDKSSPIMTRLLVPTRTYGCTCLGKRVSKIMPYFTTLPRGTKHQIKHFLHEVFQLRVATLTIKICKKHKAALRGDCSRLDETETDPPLLQVHIKINSLESLNSICATTGWDNQARRSQLI